MKIFLKILFCLVVMGSQGLEAQDYFSELKRMNKLIAEAPVFYTEMTTNYYEDGKYSKPFYTISTIIRKKGDTYFYTMGSNEIFIDNDLMLMVNNELKTISVQPIKEEQRFDVGKILPAIDSFIKDFKYPIKKIDSGSSESCYLIEMEEQGVYRLSLCFNKSTSWFNKIDYWINYDQFGQKGKVETVFTNTTLHKKFKSETFSLDQFLIRTKKGYQPAAKYNGYAVFDDTVTK